MVFFLSVKGTGANYYWVGGTGNWTDLNHWATTSGGATLHTQIPTALDDVFFDANSFPAAGQVVTLNALTMLTHDMNWTGATNNPTLAGVSANLLKIYGSLTFISNMNQSFAGPVSFEATITGKTLTCAGRSFNNIVSFNGGGGGWTLQDALAITNTLYLNNGTLTTNNQTVSAAQFASLSLAARTLNMGSSVFNLSATGVFWNVSALTGLILNCGTSTINSTASNPTFSGGNLTYYDLNFVFATSSSAGIADNNSFHNVSFACDGAIVGTNTFNNVTFSKNGTIYANNTFNNLAFTAGYTYVLRNAQTQTVNGIFSASGNCGALIAINSDISGSQATISHPPGAVTVSFVALQDINTAGGASFTANNAVDLGNNTGWTINTALPRSLYWVGNGGNWNDGNHWSLSSGGTPSGCSPTPLDDVFFDANSYSLPGQVTTINIPTAYCRDMDWTGATNNPGLAGVTANQLKIYGSLTFIVAMNQSFAGPVSFEATTTGKTITSAGRSFSNTLSFNGAGGGWTLQDAMAITNTIFLNSGTLTTNNKTVNADQFYSLSLAARTLNMGSSIFNLSGGTCWNVSASGGLILNCGSSTINSTAGNSNFYGGGLTYYDLNLLSGGSIVDNNFFHDVSFASNGTIIDNNSFNNVTFSKNGTIYANNTFNNLAFTAGYSYVLRTAKIQTVNGIFSAAGNCGALIAINTDIAGSQSTISHPPGAVTVSFVTLQDINTAGGASFTANNAVDLGNNTGWTINTALPKALYWIGNGGNWNDGNHWSLSSGGPPSGCSPTPLDDVFFDANSYSLPGQITTINIPTAYCRDMNWTGAANNPGLAGVTANQLKIYGSLTFISNMNQTFTGTVSFESATAGKTITSAGRSFNNIAFNGAGGGWTLQDALAITNTLYLNNGTLTTNNQTVNATQFYSNSLAARTLNMGSSVFNLSGPTFWNVSAPAGLTLNCGTSTINSTNNVGASNSTLLGGNLTYYDLNFVNASIVSGVIIDNNSFHNVSFVSNGVINDDNIFNNVTFSKNGTIYGNNTFNNLVFTAGYTYVLGNSKNQTVVDKWLIQGSCTSYIILQSSTPGSFATVTKTTNSVTGFNIHIRDIHCTGGSNFIAYNSVDLGGNSGWNFSTLPPLSDPAAINGPAAVCTGETGVIYYIPPAPGAISYIWTVPPGATITSGQGDTLITVDFTGASSGNITVTAFSGCALSNPSTLTVVVGSNFLPAVTIAADPGNTICAGTSVTFTATPVNGGSSPVYQWKLNGINVGTNSATYNSAVLANGDNVSVIMTSALACASPTTATSNTISMAVNASSTPSVTITANPAGPVCAGTAVTFTAAAISIAGGTVSYDFKVNGTSMQTGASNIFTTTGLANGNTVNCDISISGGTCLTSTSATSNTISMQVNPNLTPAVTIVANPAGAVCTGTVVTFTATPVTGGTTPSYQWQVNGINAGTNSASFATTGLLNGDNVRVIMTSTANCVSPSNPASNTITMLVNPVSTPSVTITANPGASVCAGTSVTFTAIAGGIAGGTVNYDFKVNGSSVQNGASNIFITAGLANGNAVSCDISISGATCLTSTFGISNTITMTIDPVPVISFNPVNPSILSGNAIQLNASVTGNIVSYLWTPAAGLSNTTLSNPVANPVMTTVYNLRVISAGNCIADKDLTVAVLKDIYIPNSFTPNGDGKNDIFRIPPGTSFALKSFSVYDRYGNLVFSSTDINEGWDGKYKGVRSPIGAYTYLIKGSDYRREIILTGTVLVIR